MLETLSRTIREFKIFDHNSDLTVHTNVLGLARSCLAFSLLLNFLFTDVYVYFPDSELINSLPFGIPNFFIFFGTDNLRFAISLACIILFIVISGYIPQLTGILHAWIATSFFQSAILVEGGDQIAQIITIFLIPITLADKRINHWHKSSYFDYTQGEFVQYFVYSCMVLIRIQMSIVYFFAAAVKINKSFWIDGSAFYYWFTHMPFGVSEKIANIFLPVISNIYVTSLISWGAIFTEILLFSALFVKRKSRPFYFVLGVFFHFMIICIHGLWAFFFVMLGGLVIYLLPWNKRLHTTLLGRWLNNK